MATDGDRAAARLAAFRLVEAAQVHDVTAELAAAQAEAQQQDWPEVARVLVYAAVVAGLTNADPSVGDAITRLYDAAEAAGDRTMLSTALASRAAHNLTSDVPRVRESAYRDLARATALLELAGGEALERATAYVACATAYSACEIWELEEELYAAATPLLAECEIPLLDAVVAYNRAEAFVRLMCGLREVDELDELRRLAPAASAAVAAAREAPMPSAWSVEVEVLEQLLAALVDGRLPEPATRLDQWVEDELVIGVGPVTGLLHLADALCEAHTGRWAAVAEHARQAIDLSTDGLATSARALAMRLAAQAEAAQGAGGSSEALRYAESSARRRWETRMQMVGSARANLQTEQLRVERDRHARAALADELTGLANRRGYSLHLQGLRRRRVQHPVAALLVDIDDFKAVNDNHGHAVGDEVLARVAHTLASGIRSGDLVARLGGDEFVALLDDLDADAAYRRAADLLQRLAAEPWGALAPGLDLAVSIGVAGGEPGDDPEQLVRRADTALYAAKARGGSRVEVDTRTEDDGLPLAVTSRVRRVDRPAP